MVIGVGGVRATRRNNRFISSTVPHLVGKRENLNAITYRNESNRNYDNVRVLEAKDTLGHDKN